MRASEANIKDALLTRSQHHLLIIDDKEFAKKELLEKNGYRCQHVRDLDSIKFAESFTIVLCDIDDVGKKLGGKHGGFLISELKKTFPLKPIISFSANTHSPDLNRYFLLSNAIMKKDADLDEWIEVLDDISMKATDPIEQWKSARRLLLEAGTRIDLVMKLEDQFVSHARKGGGMKEFVRESMEDNGISEQAKSILSSLASNLLMKAVGL